MDRTWQDVKYAFRSLRRGGALIAIAVLSLGVGIGANAAIFSAVDVFMLRPLPYPDSDELYAVFTTNPERGWNTVWYSVPDLLDFRERSRTLSLAGTDPTNFNLADGDRPERLQGMRVTPGFFRVLGAQPALGRGFAPEEEAEGRHRVAVISDGLFMRRFGGDPSILGRTVLLDGQQYTVVGIMPPKFWYLYPGVDVWVPLAISGDERRNSHYVHVLGRLRSGLSPEQAEAEAQRIAAQLASEHPDTNEGNSARLLSLHEDVFDEGFKMGSLIATVAVLFLLLIACANVANLLLTHAAGREREVAVRSALGAGRLRILRQFLAEAMMLALAGGVLGLGLAVAGIKGLVALMPPWFPRVDEIGLNPRVLLFTLAVALLSALLVGLAPAIQSLKTHLVESLKEGGRGGTAAKSARLRKALVIGEVSLALVLLVASSLLVRAFVEIRLIDRGFDERDVLTFGIALPAHDYPDTAAVVGFHERLSERLRALPGVTEVGATTILPVHGNSMTYYWLAGEDVSSDLERKLTDWRDITPGYLEALDIPVVRGRGIEGSDRPDARSVILVNEAMAERHWPGEDPIGQELAFNSGTREIVGVVADTRELGDQAGRRPMVYFSAYQDDDRYLSWVVESAVPPGSLVEPIRALVAQVDPNLPVNQIEPLSARINERLGGDTIMAKIMAVVALIALILALAGVYGVMAFSVAQRTQELGIRMALGAGYRDVISMVMRQGAFLAVVGVIVGLIVALGVSRALARFLFGVSPFEPLIYSAVAVVLLAAALLATFFPARRATRVEPVVALRAE